jgi:LacI family transcriptional regulator
MYSESIECLFFTLPSDRNPPETHLFKEKTLSYFYRVASHWGNKYIWGEEIMLESDMPTVPDNPETIDAPGQAQSQSQIQPQKSKPATIRDVAHQAGVSLATVSRVLNGSATVDPEMTRRVQEVAAQLKYQPSRAARTLAGRSSFLVGLLVTDMNNPFYIDLIRGVEEVAQQEGYLLIVCNTLEDPQREQQYIEVLAAEPIAGAIIIPTQGQAPGLSLLKERHIPMVTVDRRVQDCSTDAVLTDNVNAGREAVMHLIGNGYRRIGVIGGPKAVTNMNERMQGYRQALQEAGIAFDACLEQRSAHINEETGFQLTNKLLDIQPPIEALFTTNNRFTIGALRALQARHKRIPEDIALVGFDDVHWAIPKLLSITTVIQSAYELGSAAANRLFQLIHNPTSPRQEIILQYQLQIQDSSRPRTSLSRRR